MIQAARKQIGAIVMIGVASALVLGGVAAAQGDSQGGSQGSRGAGSMPGPPIGGPMQGLTYAEFHVQKNGQEQVLRLDQGKIASVSSSSITLTENDGSSVTIPLNESTKVLTGPGQSATIGDLSEGETVVVSGPQGGPAKSVMVAPKPGQMKGTPPGWRAVSTSTPRWRLIHGGWEVGRANRSPHLLVRRSRMRG